MSLKGEKTKQEIREKACQLFAEKGFKEVTMKNICELTGLSRGGLYRHYESTGQIFLEIVNAFSDRQKKEVLTKIQRRIPATTILEELLSKYASEMIDSETSLSLAIYEFYSNPAISKEDNSVKRQYEECEMKLIGEVPAMCNTKRTLVLRKYKINNIRKIQRKVPPSWPPESLKNLDVEVCAEHV